MRFVLFTTNLAGGGAEKALAKIAEGLVARGHTVDFIVCEDSGAYTPPENCGFTALSRQASHGWIGKRQLAWRLKRLLDNTAYDLLVSTLPFADEVAAMTGASRHICRIANTLSAEIVRLPVAKARRRQQRYQRLYGARRVVAVSQGVATDLKAGLGIPADLIRVIPNPFDFSAIRRLSSERCANPPDEPYILHVGRYAKQKRHDLLLTAYAQMAQQGCSHRLVLLTPPNADLTELIAAHGLERRVSVAGFQGNPYPWMGGADLLTLCSDHEGLPNVLIEALICGTRVVSTDCPSGPREILRGDFAQWLVPCGDAGALAQTMQAALASPRPSPDVVAELLAPYEAGCAYEAWETLASGAV